MENMLKLLVQKANPEGITAELRRLDPKNTKNED